MKLKKSIIIIIILAVGGMSFFLLENRSLNKWDIPSDKSMYTVAIVHNSINHNTLEEIIKDIYALYNFEKAGEGMDSYNQKWRNSGYIRFNFMYTEDTDLTLESINLKKKIKTIFGRHGEETGWELCVIDDRGNRY